MILAFSLLACGTAENPYVHLADVANPSLVVNAGDLPPEGQRLQVLVHPELAAVCRPIPELKADIDGVELKRLHGKYDDGKYAYDRDCNVYEFVADAAVIAKLPPKAENVVTVTDGTTTISLTAAGLFVKPVLSAPAAPVPAGSGVSLAWTPGGDTVDTTVPVSVQLQAEGAEAVAATGVKATGAAVEFTVPVELSGPVTASLYGTAAFTPPVSKCVGAVSCSASRAFLLDPLKFEVTAATPEAIAAAKAAAAAAPAPGAAAAAPGAAPAPASAPAPAPK